jgi:DNA-binding transcriptional ArsR family regulator
MTLPGTVTAFKLAADNSRLSILLLLEREQTCAGDIAGAVRITQPLASHNLALLAAGGLIEAVRDGKRRVYSLTAEGLKLVAALEPLLAA